MIRSKVSPRRVRYFATDELAKRYTAARPSAVAQSSPAAAGSRTKARWAADEPMRITSKTKIFIAPPLPRNVFRTNTYPQF